MKKIFLSLLGVFFFSSLAFGQEYANKIIIKLEPGVSSSAMAAKLDSIHRIYKIRQLYQKVLEIRPDFIDLQNQYVLELHETSDVVSAAADFARISGVVSASPVTRVQAFTTTPNDTYFASGSQYGLVNIQMTSAWDRTTGASDLLIAVLDTGVNYNHDDLTDRIDVANGYDFVNNDTDPWDDHSGVHGTTVSGVIAAATNNAKGIAGMTWQGKVLPIKVLDSRGSGDIDNIVEGLAWARAKGADVVNMSFGQYSDDSTLKAACDATYAAGIVLAAAAGNDNTSNLTYPACYASVLAVAAVDSSDHRSVWNAAQASNYGTWVDVAAPGTSIYTTYSGNTYHASSGTSLASPFVAGLAGLIRAANTSLTPQQVMDKLTSEVDSIDALNPGFEGLLGGRINGAYTLSRAIAAISSPANGAHVKGTVAIVGTAAGSTFTDYRLEDLVAGALVATIESSTVAVTSGTLGTWDTSSLSGAHTLRLSVGSTSNSSEVSVGVIVDNTAPIAQISSPTGSAAVGSTLTIVGTASDQYLNYYTLEYGMGSAPSSFEEILTSYNSVSSGVLGTWETKGLNGTYLLRLRTVDRAGTTSLASVALTVVNLEDPIKAAVASAGLPLTYPVPNPFNMGTTTECSLNYVLAGNFDTKIYLFDFSGKLMWQQSYVAGTNGGKSGSNSPAWNGYDLAGQRANKGLYFYQVVAEAKIIARGKIILLN